MIICVSANPAIDRRLRVSQLRSGQVNRALSAVAAPGGKAAHVAMAALALGARTTWVGFLGGAAGEECERGLKSLGIDVAPIRVKSPTRTNLEIISATGAVTEVLEPGGEVGPDEVGELLTTCEWVFERRGGSQVALSGSLPPGAPVDLYAQIIRLARARGCRTLLDTSGASLFAALASSPDFIKPNRDEAARALRYPIEGEQAAVAAARWLVERGARSAAISLGAEGLVWLGATDAGPIIARPPAIDAISTVGCGDATLAGFAVAAARALSVEETARLAAACGAANCRAELPGMIKAEEVSRIKPLVTVRPLQENGKSDVERRTANGNSELTARTGQSPRQGPQPAVQDFGSDHPK